MTSAPQFRNLATLTVLLKASLGAFTAVSAIGLWTGWLEIELLQRVASGGIVSEAEAVAIDQRQAAVGGLHLLVYLITGVMFLRWTYLSSHNSRALGGPGVEFTPGWAVGWYFVPFANLVLPYQALKETFKASNPDFIDAWQRAPHPLILPVWWTLWIGATFLGKAALRASFRGDTITELVLSSWIGFASGLLDVSLGLVAIALVAMLHKWQTEKHRRLAPVAA